MNIKLETVKQYTARCFNKYSDVASRYAFELGIMQSLLNTCLNQMTPEPLQTAFHYLRNEPEFQNP